LPTDQRLDLISDRQIDMFFEYAMSYTDEAARWAYQKEDEKHDFDEEQLREIGYTEEEIAEINK